MICRITYVSNAGWARIKQMASESVQQNIEQSEEDPAGSEFRVL